MTCIESSYAPTDHGYARILHEGKNEYHHRVVYARTNGLPLSELVGKVVRHTCDNPRCINPAHLVLGTQADNIADMTAKQRQARGSMKSKLTEANVLAIRQRARREQYRGIASDFGITVQSVCDIVARRSWKHI